MQLEDHLGDVIRKARIGANVSAEAAAQAAGVPTETLKSLEETGQLPRDTNLDPLATLVGLSGSKLSDLANGWSPPAIDFSVWRELRQISSTQHGNTVNCYLIWD